MSRRRTISRAAGLVLAASSLLTCARAPWQGPKWNVVVVTFDTTRADHLGSYGKESARTPNLDRLAAEGYRFAHAYTAVPVTLPSHATLFTGRYPMAHGVRDNGLFSLPAGEITLAERLRDEGWQTGAAIGAFPLVRGFGIEQGFGFFEDHITVQAEDFRGARMEAKEGIFFDERPATRVNDAALPWLRAHIDEPFFLWLHYWDPHQPLIPPEPFSQLYAHDPYQGEIAFADHSLGAVLRELETAGVYDRTLIVMSGDHGEGLGEHGEQSHSQLIYDATLHVPLIMKVPEAAGSRVIEQRVGTVDVVPTVLELLGLEPHDGIQGRSLVPAMFHDGREPESRGLYYAETLSPRLSYGWGELRALYEGSSKYIHGPRSELFDLTDDPREIRNRLDAQADEGTRMRSALEAFIDRRAESAAVDAVQDVDPETRQRLAALGYIAGGGDDPTSVEEGLRTDGDPPQDHVREMSWVSQVKLHLQQGHHLAARELAEKLVAADPKSGYYLGLLAIAHMHLGHFDQAVALLEGAEHAAVAQNDALFLSVTTQLFERGQRARAVRLLRRLLDGHASAYGHKLLADMLETQGDPEGRERELRAALEIDGRYAEAMLDLAVAMARDGRHDEAEAMFERLLEEHPRHAKGHMNYGVLLLETQRWDVAIERFTRATQLDPTYWQAYLARLAVHVDRGESEAAQAILAELERRCDDEPTLRRARDMTRKL